MVRIAMILLCLLLAAAAAGRYKAETSVRETRRTLEEIEKAKARELSEIQLLRAEIAFLENPERLKEVAEKVTDLEPLSAAQVMTAEEFRVAFGAEESSPAPEMPDGDVILHALAMADLGLAGAQHME